MPEPVTTVTSNSEARSGDVVMAPGQTTGWQRLPGTETSIVSAGTLTILTEDECDPVRFSSGDAVVLPDAQVHLVRNDGPVPVELVVTSLLAPGRPDSTDARDPC